MLEEDIVRVLVLPDGELRGPATWSIAPGTDDTPFDGRDRRDLGGFALPPFELQVEADTLRLETGKIRLSVALAGGHCAWAIRQGGQWRAVLSDRATQAYNFGFWDAQVYHYVRREPGEMYFAWASAPASWTARASATRCATSTRWATARARPIRCTSTSRST